LGPAQPTGAAGGRVEVAFDDTIDFGSFKSYAWKPGTPARRSDPEGDIHAAVERELERVGLREEESGADLWITTHVLTDRHTLADLEKLNYWEFWSGVASVDPYDVAAGTLVIDVEDTITGGRIWRGAATATARGPVDTAGKKIEGLVKKLFKRFPRSK
jgi:hypothetical protein